VVEIVFDTVRLLCPVIGLHPGDVVDCEERTPRSIALRRPDGTRVVIDPFYASFIAIRSHVGRNAVARSRAIRGRLPTNASRGFRPDRVPVRLWRMRRHETPERSWSWVRTTRSST
jgi:hypothetical protein